MEPEVPERFQGLLRHVIVLDHHRGGLFRSEDDLCGHSGGHWFVFVVKKLDLINWQGFSGGAGPSIVKGRMDWDTYLRHAEALHTGTAEPFCEAFHHCLRAVGAEGDADRVVDIVRLRRPFLQDRDHRASCKAVLFLMHIFSAGPAAVQRILSYNFETGRGHAVSILP